MSKVTGVKSVDLKIKATGHGVVNWNGPTRLMGEDGNEVNNHTLPKLRGYTNLSGRIKAENGYKYKRQATDIDFSKTPLYIASNCIRHHLFKDQAYDLHYANKSNALQVLASITGLLRGYVITNAGYNRTSPLLIEDFVDQLGNGNFEQMGRSGTKEKQETKKGDEKSNSFFSKTTFGETEYVSYASISVEELQFISLDNQFDRAALNIKDGEGKKVAKVVCDFIQSLNPELKPEVVFHENYVRRGSIFNIGEMGLLLNDDAIQALVDEMIDRIKLLGIKQAKGYMLVEEVDVDYNDSAQMMRIKKGSAITNPSRNNSYAVYFEGK